jgi:carbon starvation protein
MFGATNQLLAGLAFMVTVFYLWRRNKPVWFVVPPMLLMLTLPAWALLWQLFNSESGWAWPFRAMLIGEQAWQWQNSHLLFGIGVIALALQLWIVVEGALLWPRAKGVLEETLPPLDSVVPLPAAGGGP